MSEEDKYYKFYFFYYNPDDPRLFVPKRLQWTGWTLNFANPVSWLFIAAVLMIIGILPFLLK